MKKTEIPFNKKSEVNAFGKFIAQMVREGIVFNVEFTDTHFIVILTGGF